MSAIRKIIIVFFLFLAIVVFIKSNYRSTVKLGFVAGLSGRRSQLGVSARNSLILAVEKLNNRGGLLGRKVELIIKDNKSDPAYVGKAIEELLAEDVFAIIGPFTSNMAKNTLNAIRDREVLLISPTISTDAISGIDDNFFRVISPASKQAEAMANKVMRDGNTRVAIVYDASNKEYTEPIYKRFSAHIVNGGTELVFVSDMDPEKPSTDFLSIAKSIKSSGADSVFIVSSGIDAAGLCQQIQRLNIHPNLYGSRWVKSGKVVEYGGRSVEGMVLISDYYSDVRSKEYYDFVNQYMKKYNDTISFAQTYVSDALMVLSIGVEKAKSLKYKKIANAIVDIGVFKGLDSDFKIDRYGDTQRPHSLVVINNGKFEYIDTID